MALDFNTAPYYDDFDSEKGFLKILFNPGRSVQARELTQIQSILQNQLSSGASHIFKDGTPVVGGQVDLNIRHYIQLAAADANWLGRVVRGETSNAIGRINKLHDDENTPIYYIQPLSGAFGGAESVTTYDTVCNPHCHGAACTDAHPEFTTSQTCTDSGLTWDACYDDSGQCATNTWYSAGLLPKSGTIVSAGKGTEATVTPGIYYVASQFVPVLEQTIFVDYISNTPTGVVGLLINESIVHATEDETLVDPASGFYNHNAPGADRYTVELALTLDSDIVDKTQFLPIITVDAGDIIKRVKSTSYSTIINELAHRTYDESGDYTTQAFPIVVKDHINDPTQYTIQIEPGKAYVRGHEHELVDTIEISAPKARDVRSVTDASIKADFGPYFEVNSTNDISGVFNILNKEEIKFITNPTYTGIEAQLEVGPTRRITHFTSYGSGFRLYVDQPQDLDVISPATYIVSSLDPTTFVKLHRPTGKAVPLGTFRPWLFEVGSMVSNITKVNYKSQKEYAVTIQSSQIAINAGTNNMYWDEVLYVWNNTTGEIIPKNETSITSGIVWEFDYANTSGTLRIVDAAINSASTAYSTHDVKLLANIEFKPGTPKTISLEEVLSANVDLNAGGKLMLPRGTISVSAIYDTILGADVSNDFTFINTDFDTELENCFATWISDSPANFGRTYQVSYTHYVYDTATQDQNTQYFNVNSYLTGNVPYSDINTYTGYYAPYGNYRLADALDFRTIVDDFSTGSYLPLPNQNITVDYEYYLPRADRLTITSNGEFIISQGYSSEGAMLPSEKDTEMTLYNFYVPAYTYDVANISATMVDQRNFTMSDLRDLEERVDSLEYYTSLNLLEQTTEAMQVTDVNGLDRYKNGMLVDSFVDHGIGDYTNKDYYVSIYPEGGICTTPFTMKGYDFTPRSYTGMKLNDKTWTLDYDVIEGWIKQTNGSARLNLNPFAKLSWSGFLEISPSSDTWFEETYAPAVIVQNQNNNNVRKQVELYGTQTRWGAWKTTWTGWKDSGGKKNQVAGTTETKWRGKTADVHPGWGADRPVDVNTIDGKIGPDGQSNIKGFTLDKIWNQGWMATNTWVGNVPQIFRRPSKTFDLWKSTVTTGATWQQDQTAKSTSVRTGTKTFMETKESRTTVGNKQIDSSSINWMRSIPIKITGDKLRPATTMHFQFDGVNVDAYCKPLGGSNGDPISTDSRGRLRDVTFTIPSTPTTRFNTGNKVLEVQDAFNEEMTTNAEATFSSAGTLNTRQRTIMSTLQAVTKSTAVSGSKSSTSTRTVNRGGATTTTTQKKTIREYYDPVAESFMVSGEDGGVFVDSIDVYFASKDANGIPVRCEIREMMNGYPVFDSLPGASKFLYPEEIAVDWETGTADTRFTFSDPVYLMDGTEYCFVLISDSLEYNIWISELGDRDRATGAYIGTQPFLGSMFTSQNNSTWTPEQTKDVKFKINKCKFDTLSVGQVTLGLRDNIAELQTGTGFTPNLQPMVLPGTDVTYSAYIAQGDETIYGIVDGEDQQFSEQKVMDMSNVAINSPMEFTCELTTQNENISPVFNAERLSAIMQNNVIHDNATDSKNKMGVYVSKMVQLANPAEDLQMFLSIQEVPETYFKVFYDTGSVVPRYVDIEFNANTTTHGSYDVNPYEEEYAFIYASSPEIQITAGSNVVSSWNGIVGPESASAYVDGDGDVDNTTRMHLTDISDLKSITRYSYISKYDLEGATSGTDANINDANFAVGDIWFGNGSTTNRIFYRKIRLLDGTLSKEEVPVLRIVSIVDAGHDDFAASLAVVEEPIVTWREMKDSGVPNSNFIIATEREFLEHTFAPLKKIVNEFSTFRIKIEMYSTNPVYMPAMRELRVLAVT